MNVLLWGLKIFGIMKDELRNMQVSITKSLLLYAIQLEVAQ